MSTIGCAVHEDYHGEECDACAVDALSEHGDFKGLVAFAKNQLEEREADANDRRTLTTSLAQHKAALRAIVEAQAAICAENAIATLEARDAAIDAARALLSKGEP